MDYQSEDEYYYCPSSPQTDDLIFKTHIGNYTKDITLVVMSAIRVAYFPYVLYRVSQTCKNWRAFFGRPAFMNWLPILILLTSISSLAFGALLLYGTVIGEGKVICRLNSSDLTFMVIATYLTGVCHIMFAAEFLNTLVAL